ncbi:MAG TPA: peptide MFS transporter [Gemmatimonadaceae bacterium]|nr:peptide MFS transporter [Gemmatimonadaceae bacterium]
MATTRPPDRKMAADIGATATDIPPELDTRFFGHPRGLSTLFFTEMWERFSFYGLRPLLILFMTAALIDGGFGFDRTQASAIVGIYASSVYLSSLPGGWIADRLLGLRRAIFLGAVLISLGHISIGFSAFAGSRVPFFLGLVLIVLGTGLLKPNISAIVGDLYPEGGSRRDAGFSIFYMGINMGAFLGQLVTGLLGERVGWHWGFGAAGVGMLLGLLVYWLRAPKTLGNIGMDITRHPDPVVQEKQTRQGKVGVYIGLAIITLVVILASSGVISLNPQAIGQNMLYVLVGTAVAYFGYIFAAGGLNGDEKKRIVVIGVLFLAAAVFWSAFEQAPTSLNLFAFDFTDRNVFGWEVPATWFQSVNSAFIILLAPAFAALWTALGRRNRDLSSPAKFALGLAFAAVGFAMMIQASQIVVAGGPGTRVAIWWLVGSYFFQTVGELALSPVGLSSMTKLSPRKYVGQMMGIWFLASSVGNLIGGLVGGHVDPENLEQMPRLFTLTTLSLLGAAVLLGLLVVPIRRMMARTA